MEDGVAAGRNVCSATLQMRDLLDALPPGES
jgi:hypothetical protein